MPSYELGDVDQRRTEVPGCTREELPHPAWMGVSASRTVSGQTDRRMLRSGEASGGQGDSGAHGTSCSAGCPWEGQPAMCRFLTLGNGT